MKQFFMVFGVLMLIVCGGARGFADTADGSPPVIDGGRVVAVTVYQGQALVTRVVDFESDGQPFEVIVGRLPQQITPGSLYAEPLKDDNNAGAEIRSVRYRVRAVAQDTRKEVREVDEKIQGVRDEIAANTKRTELLNSQKQYLKKLEGFTTVNADRELQNGVLNAGTLKDLTSLVFDRRQQIGEQELELAITKRELEGRLAKLSADRNRLTRGSSRSLREAVVFIDPKQAGRQQFRLTYLVSGATWSPSYNLRADADGGSVTVEYNASIQQLSGENWDNVAMTLSTASPSLVATAPELKPLPIRLAAVVNRGGGKFQRLAGEAYEQQRQSLSQRQRALSKARNYAAPANSPASDLFDGSQRASRFTGDRRFNGGSGFGGGGFGAAISQFSDGLRASDLNLNGIANELQVLDFNCDFDAVPRLAKPDRGEGISVVYRLAGQTSLPSRSDQQLIKIAALPLAGDFYRVARPLLTRYVYQEAEVENDSDLVLLAGPAATFIGERFVGRGAVPTVAVGESFTIGLGIDESLRVERELVACKQRVQGGNRVQRFDYRLTLQNFGVSAAAVRLFDRLPVAGDQQSDEPIKVTLLEATPDPKNADRVADDDGLLRWDVTAPPRNESVGEVTIDYAMQVEFDKNRTISLAQAE